MKITQPRIAKDLKENADLVTTFCCDDDMENCLCRNQVITYIEKEHFSIQSCTFTNCSFSDCKIKKSQFTDVIFKNCDLSNINLSGCSFFRVEFIDCKLTGTNLTEGTFNQILFKQCTVHQRFRRQLPLAI